MLKLPKSFSKFVFYQSYLLSGTLGRQLCLIRLLQLQWYLLNIHTVTVMKIRVVKWLDVTILIVYMAHGFTLNVSRYLNHVPVSGIVQTTGQCLSFPVNGSGLSSDFTLC